MTVPIPELLWLSIGVSVSEALVLSVNFSRYDKPVLGMPTLPVAFPSLRLTDTPRPPMVQDVPVLLKLSVNPLNNLIPIYSNANWLTFEEFLNPILSKMEKEHLDGVDEFIWLAPSDGFWGRSLELTNCFGKLISKATTSGKSSKPLYKLKMYAPTF